MKIVAVADPETALAFRLAGIETVVLEKEEPIGIIKKIITDKEIGLVLITERLAMRAGDKFKELINTVNLPLFIEIPDTRGPARKRMSNVERMAAILRR